MNDSNYSNDPASEENIGFADKYSVTGESKFSVDGTLPRDSEIISERHYQLQGIHPSHRDRHPDAAPLSDSGANEKMSNEGRSFRPSDTTIHEEVCEALLKAYDVNSSEIEIYVQDGDVILKGFVDTTDVKMKVIDLVTTVDGVTGIQNELEVIYDLRPGEKMETEGLIHNRMNMI
jgi:hypothetical protein